MVVRFTFGTIAPDDLENREIQTGFHCLACAAGGGSSCTGAVL
ncbi:MAG: DUF3641 domain-containing protein [Verrucomicrobiota bacterium]|nr:DUF3641 domain-containing protein [Verrucomicrobiota bacterium]